MAIPNRYANAGDGTGIESPLVNASDDRLLRRFLLSLGILDGADENSTVRENNHFLHGSMMPRPLFPNNAPDCGPPAQTKVQTHLRISLFPAGLITTLPKPVLHAVCDRYSIGSGIPP